MIKTLQDLEDFSNKYKIPMVYQEIMPMAFSVTIFERDELFVRSWIDSNKAAGILVHYKITPDGYGDDKIKLVEGIRNNS